MGAGFERHIEGQTGQSVVSDPGRRFAQGLEQSWIKVGYTRNLVIKDCRAVGDGTVSLAQRPGTAAASDVEGWVARKKGQIR